MSTCAKNQKDINFFEVKAHIAWAIWKLLSARSGIVNRDFYNDCALILSHDGG